MNIEFIGDLSKNDVKAIVELTKGAKSILEFGVGGSTQIMLQNNPNAAIVSIDTSLEWIERTKKNIKLLNIKHDNYKFCIYKDVDFIGNFDVIFDDGVDDKRLEFALKSWPLLNNGGIMFFHDTRRSQDIKNVSEVLNRCFNEISKIEINYLDSNITAIYKRKSPLYYENWNIVEGKSPWMYGAEEYENRNRDNN